MRGSPAVTGSNATFINAVSGPIKKSSGTGGEAQVDKRRRSTMAGPDRAFRRNSLYLGVVGALAATVGLVTPATVDARLVKFVVSSKESPTFGGYSFAGVGQYEKLVGMAYGELDPNDPKNSGIVDIQLAPRNASGKVEYSHTFYILKPIDLSLGAHRMMYEPPNRGGKTVSALNRGVGGNDPGAVTDPNLLANSFLMPRGYTLAFSGWDYSAGTSMANFNSMINLPVAKNPDGSTITGP